MDIATAHNLRSLDALATLLGRLGRLSDESPARRAPKPLTRGLIVVLALALFALQ